MSNKRDQDTVIRFATVKDLASCYSFDYVKDYDPLKARAKQILSRKIDQKEIIVAESGGKIVGYVRMNDIVFKPYLGYIVVDERFRSKGLGKRMLEFLEASLRRQGHTVLYSSSQADASRSQNWHRKMGFEECGIIAGFNNRTFDDHPSVGVIGEVYFRKIIG